MDPRDHITAALNFLQLSDSPIAQQNRLLRSELLWCAAAHAVKAVAKQQGWENKSHDDLFHAVRLLAHNRNDPRLIRCFNQASRLHRNMYEGDMNDRAIDRSRRQVRCLVHRLESLIN